MTKNTILLCSSGPPSHNKPNPPAAPGTYVLVLRCTSTRAIRVGRLGTMRLQPGYYLYVGSAFGPGGRRARIDYLRRYNRLEAVWHASGARREHEWAAKVAAMPGAAIVVRGFGSSDCRCEAHLYWFEETPAADLRQVLGGNGAVVTESALPDRRATHR